MHAQICAVDNTEFLVSSFLYCIFTIFANDKWSCHVFMKLSVTQERGKQIICPPEDDPLHLSCFSFAG